MRNTWKLLTVAALILAGCKGKDTKPESKPEGAGDKPQATDVTYTIKIKNYPAAGKSVTEKTTEKTTGTNKISDGTGKVLKDDKEDSTKEQVVIMTVLEGGDKRPKKYKEVYEKASQTKDGKTTTLPLEGKTVTYELKGDKYEATVEGGDLPPLELMKLTSKANKPDSEEALLPKKPVKVGESWNIDLKEMSKSGAGPGGMDEAKSSGTAKLLKVNDKKVGIIEIKMTLVPKAGAPGPALTIQAEGTIETAIDGSSTAGTMSTKAKISGKGEFEQMGMKIKMDIDATTTEEKTRTAEK